MAVYEYDAIVVGAGPNGLAAAITLQQAGLSILLIEGAGIIGGGMRSSALTLPGYLSDVCSAIHPMAAASPFFQQLPLDKFGLEYINPPVLAAHPFDNGDAAVLKHSLYETADFLGPDKNAYLNLIGPIVDSWPDIAADVLGPLRFPKYPVDLLKFGIPALRSALGIANKFKTQEAKGLWAGMAAHSLLPLDRLTTAAIGLVLMANGHIKGWPIPKGGSQQIANALAGYFVSLGGKIQTDWYVRSLKELPSAKAILFDLGPKQLLEIAGESLSGFYKWQLKRYRYGAGVFKIDWALDGAVPFKATACRAAGTVHIGGTLQEIAVSERETSAGIITEKPFVLLAQQSLFDTGRVPEGRQALWGYCHVPNGSMADRTAAIENQIERFAPGFKDRILARHVFNTAQMERYNANYIGGDINGGILDIWQLYTRPALRRSPYRTSAKGIYLCSASTPPGGGVHGMPGFHAAKRALEDIWRL
ncbi:phytoene desaturase family protein [Mucilaginibacter sp. X5P1]|uniref:phytoene desaturase family protein n=1 Tax=Mucilaginibacter sp. X5P1 TaxID=2723088 RepID=UPI00161A6BF7|nr:NAD(P)/FAD-dependent oxidoreductase [Mucilaginibacter sp. X5P1]MBB6137256.1 phytoene dehydrogenase-like protein [Mucilaginibacter sp. X5P1]